MRFPIFVGVTGHRDIRAEDLPRLRELVWSELERLVNEHPNSEVVMLNSLAAGADTLCAQIAVDMGLRLVCPLPMNVDEYRFDFSENELNDFNALLEKTEESFVVENRFIIHGITSRDDCYRSASYYVAANCYVLLALWDGVPAERKSCGTSKAVEYMLEEVFVSKNLLLKNRMNSSVIHIKCSRQSSSEYIEPELRLIENTEGCQKRLLDRIDDLNSYLEDEDGIIKLLATCHDASIQNYLLDIIEDASMLRKALPGSCTYSIISRIAELDGVSEIDVVYENPELIIPALKMQADWRSKDLLIELYINKHGDSIIREAQKRIAELERQMVDLANDTSLDEFEYIDAEYKNDYLEEQCANIRLELFERVCKQEV